MNEFENPEAQRIKPPEQQEGEHGEKPVEKPRPIETVESLDKKIVGIDERIGDYTASIEDTSEKLTQARDKLSLSPMTEEAPSITQSREAVARLEEQKGNIVAQKESLVGEANTEGQSSRLEEDPRYKKFLTYETYSEAFGGVSSDVEHARNARELFKKEFPEDAKMYEVEETAHRNKRDEINRREAEDRVQQEARDTAATAEAKRQERDPMLGSFDRSIDDFISGGVVSNELGEQLKTRMRTGSPDERQAFDNAVSQASYDFRIRRGSQDAFVRALTELNEGKVSTNQMKEASNEQPATSRLVSETVASDVESTSANRASVADQQNVQRGLENLWVNSGLTDNRLTQLRDQIATGSAEEVQALNAAVMKATRTFARTRDADALAQTLMRLSVQSIEAPPSG